LANPDSLTAAARMVMAALARTPTRHSRRQQRLRDAVERAADALIEAGAHDAASELIAALDALDGDWDLEPGDEDCSAHAEDDDRPRRVLVSNWAVETAELFDLEPNIVAPHWGGNRFLSDGDKNAPLRLWRNSLKRDRGEPPPQEIETRHPDSPVAPIPFRRVTELTVIGTGRRQWAVEMVHETWSIYLAFFDTREAAERRLADYE
jgi:hypothetical protein